jgi:hypothetical protein
MTTVSEVFVGIDVSKHQLDVAVRPRGETWSATNAPQAFEAFIKRVTALSPTLIVLEARGAWKQLWSLNWPMPAWRWPW